LIATIPSRFGQGVIDKAGGIGIFVKNTVEDLSGDGSWIERIIG
jgi:hypothetical protein